jgi:hypothetical protein
VDSNTTAATQHETLRSPNSKHSNLFEQKAGHFCVRSLQKKRVQKALQKGEQFLNTQPRYVLIFINGNNTKKPRK